MKTLAAIFLLLPLLATADERILSFDSDILVHQDGSIDVTETTTVRVEGIVIKRGIVRTFPTRYEDRFGNDVVVDLQSVSAMRDGSAENFLADDYSNGVRIRFGRRDHLLERGPHTYEFRYRATHMLGYFEQRDELYWNVTGLDSAFPIDKASATVRFDFEISGDDLEIEAFTGTYGDQGRASNGRIDAGGSARFETTEILNPGSGLSIVVSWPKGFTVEPTATEKATRLLSDNLGLLIAVIGLLAVVGYYTLVWVHFGRDPAPGVIITQYEPPENFSPASLRYIRKMSYDQTVMTSAVLNLAVKGYLTINETDGEYLLYKKSSEIGLPPLAAGEAALMKALFSESASVLLINENHELLAKATSAHLASLKRDYANRYFRTNGLMILPGVAIGVSSMVVAFGVGNGGTVFTVVIAVVMVVLAGVFAYLLRQPTGLGRKLLDSLGGFQEYLEIAEKDEINLRNPPEKTPQLFESFLPYALAIGVEQAWAEKFTSVFASISGSGQVAYRPSWYQGNWNNMNIAATTDAFSNGLGSSISSAITPPGSSSGGILSGGGGFSGGGGGGGGTGGW